MNRFFLLAMVFMASLSALAEHEWGGYFSNIAPTCVRLQVENGDDNAKGHPKDRHAPARLPVLGYSGSTFVLAVPYELENVTIVIRDEEGTVLYYDTVGVISDYYMFQLGDDVLDNIYSVEFYYGGRHLYGEF